jgi:hypothetical protein
VCYFFKPPYVTIQEPANIPRAVAVPTYILVPAFGLSFHIWFITIVASSLIISRVLINAMKDKDLSFIIEKFKKLTLR